MFKPDNATASHEGRDEQGASLSRRGFLRGAALAGGGFMVAGLAACTTGAAPSWTFPLGTASIVPPSAAAVGLGAGGLAPVAESTAGSVVGSVPTLSMPPTAGATAASGVVGQSDVAAHDPSPPDFAVPSPYRPALQRPIEFSLTSNDGPSQTILISRMPDVSYHSMNFGGQVPAPTLRITEGDTVHFSLTNQGALAHSIDFHAAQTAWSKKYQEVAPGATFSFDWTAKYPGVFMYHCGAAPVLLHMADGMYGMVIVDPAAGRPPAREYVIVQSEFYGSGGEYAKMLTDPPDFVVFNGQAYRYKTTPLLANAGELVRLFLVNAGPNSFSAFHVIGALFSHVEVDGNPANAQGMRQTVEVPPGGGALVELTFAEPGTYPFVTHKFSDASKGATGLFKVS